MGAIAAEHRSVTAAVRRRSPCNMAHRGPVSLAYGEVVRRKCAARLQVSGVTIDDSGTKNVKWKPTPSERDKRWGELMDQSLEGNTAAYQQLLVLLTVAVRNAVRSRARFAGLEAEDVVQEVLLALHLKRSTWIRGTPVGPWVAAIARNKIVDALRRRGRRMEVPIEGVMEILGFDDGGGHEQAHDLERALAQLNPRQREVVRAVSLEGHTAQEAAVRLQMSEVAVRVTLHRSLKLLAGTLMCGAQ
jgi:RNA polymerase sigma factor (sigma-70 family)